VRIEIHHHHYHHGLERLDDVIGMLDRLTVRLEKFMSALDDKIAAVAKSTTDALARVQATQANLQTQLDALKQQGGTPEQLAALDTVQANLDALDPTNPATIPARPATP
jgi:hypothetical protein